MATDKNIQQVEQLKALFHKKTDSTDALKHAADSLFDNVSLKEESIQNLLKTISATEEKANNKKHKFMGYAFSAAGLFAGLSFLPALNMTANLILPIGGFVLAARASMLSVIKKTESEQIENRINRNAFLKTKASKEIQKQAGYQLLLIRKQIQNYYKALVQKDSDRVEKYESNILESTAKFESMYQEMVQAEKNVLPSLQTEIPKCLEVFDNKSLKIRKSDPKLVELDNQAMKIERQLGSQVKGALVLDALVLGAGIAVSLTTGIPVLAAVLGGGALVAANALQTIRTFKTKHQLGIKEKELFKYYKTILRGSHARMDVTHEKQQNVFETRRGLGATLEAASKPLKPKVSTDSKEKVFAGKRSGGR